MTALALSLAYLGTLAFVGWLITIRQAQFRADDAHLDAHAQTDASIKAVAEALAALDSRTDGLDQLRLDMSAIAFKLGMAPRPERPQ